MNLENYMLDVAAALGVEHLTPDDAGCYTIRIDDKFDVQAAPLQRSRVLLLAVVGRPPGQDSAAQEYLERVLGRALFHYQKDAKEVVSLDPDTQEVQLHRTEDLSACTVSSFHEALEEFTNAAEEWINYLAENNRPSGPPVPMHVLMP